MVRLRQLDRPQLRALSPKVYKENHPDLNIERRDRLLTALAKARSLHGSAGPISIAACSR